MIGSLADLGSGEDIGNHPVRSITFACLPPALEVQSWQVHLALDIRKTLLKKK